jgi:hypothetical protein
LLGLYYFRWTGTAEELKEYVRRVNEITNGTEETSYKGVFTPASDGMVCCFLREQVLTEY